MSHPSTFRIPKELIGNIWVEYPEPANACKSPDCPCNQPIHTEETK